MYKVCQTEQAFKRQREVERGLLQLMLRKNYEDITVSELCEYMQIPRKAFYRYFSSKDGALYALVDHTMTEFFQMPLQGKRARGTAVGDLDLYFIFWYENRELLDALQRSSLSGILAERSTGFALREGLLPRQFKHFSLEIQELATAFSVCGLMSMVLQWHRQGFAVPPEEMTKLAVGLMTTPLLKA